MLKIILPGVFTNLIKTFLFLFFVVNFFGIHSVTFGQGTNHKAHGKASYYAKKFQGRKTASGEFFNNYDFTAAHRTYPFNTYLNVINTKNHYNVIVRVNDRGPFSGNRIIDLSEAAARRIGGYHHGLVHVKIEVLNLLVHTKELDSIFNAHPVVDCLGNESRLDRLTLSVWRTTDLVHAIYVSNDLYLKEPVKNVLIGKSTRNGIPEYHILLTGIENKARAVKLKEEYERKGFMRVVIFNPQLLN